MRDTQELQQVETEKMLAAAVAKSQELGILMSIAITDSGGNLLAFVRMDGASAMTAKIGVRKAITSALSGHPTAFWSDRGADFPGLMHVPEVTALQGGLPVKINDICVGGVGASGAAPELDEVVAQAAIDAIS